MTIDDLERLSDDVVFVGKVTADIAPERTVRRGRSTVHVKHVADSQVDV